MIQVQNLKKYYNKGVIKALDGVSIDINKGDVMVIIGPSGSGKSTFLRSLNLLEVPTEGAMIFEGVDITRRRARMARGQHRPAGRRWAWCSSTSTSSPT